MILIASSKKNLEENIKVLKSAGGKYGLDINKQKSKVIHIRGTEQHKEIGNFEVVDTVKYLGINLEGKGRNIFRTENRG